MTRARIRYLVRKRIKGHIYLYWQPGPDLRDAGWRARRLSDNFSEAVVEAETLNADVDRWRRDGSSGPKEGTIKWLIASYSKSPRYQKIADSTKAEYRQHLKIIEETFGDLGVKAIDRRVVFAFRDQFTDRPHRGNAVMRTLRILLQHGVNLGLLDLNPAQRFEQLNTRPRDQIWTHIQEQAFLAKAHELGMPSIGLGFSLGVYTAQRLGDVLRLPWSKFDGDWINGVRQGKTGVILDVPVLTPLRSSLFAAPRRGTLILTTEEGRSYKQDHFQHRFRRVADEAGCQGLQFRDLRRTAVVRMGEAGLDATQIAQITGHTYDHTLKILETYLPRKRELAAKAAMEMERYYADLNRNPVC